MKKISLSFLLLSCMVLIYSCKKKFELPPDKTPPANSGTITVDSVYKKYNSYYFSAPAPTKLYKFSNDACITGTVMADEVSGNIYKTVFIEDATGSLQVKLLNSGGLFVGDLIRINLNNVILDDYGKMIQLDSVDIEKNVVKISSGNVVKPAKMTFSQITNLDIYGHSKFQGKLVLLDSVEFSPVYKNRLFADPVNKTNVDVILLNSNNSQVTVRTSGYSNFAGKQIPCGKGSLVAVVTQFNSTIQLVIRDYKEVAFTSGICPYINKPFDADGFTGWTLMKVSGYVPWTIGTYGGASYANISNYIGGVKYNSESWMISPPVDLSGSTNPVLNFSSAYSYSGPPLQVLISTDYTTGDPNLATWTALNPTLSTGSFVWANSGLVSLASYKTQNVRIGYKYSGTTSAGSTWEIDNFYITEN